MALGPAGCKRGPLRRTLMCKDVEALRFSCRPPAAHGGRQAGGARRAVPAAGDAGPRRPVRQGPPRTVAHRARRAAVEAGASPVLSSLGLAGPEELQVAELGLSLSDRYWFRPPDRGDVRWESVNFFDRPFSPEPGEALAPHDPDSGSAALRRVEEGGLVVTSSPDAALDGSPPRRWRIAPGGARLLAKSGEAAGLLQGPFNEAVATVLCRRILPQGAYAPCELRPNGCPAFLSACPCMVDKGRELAVAGGVVRPHKPDPSKPRCGNFAETCGAHGVPDVRPGLPRMLAVDHIVANFDRRWGNFGVIAETDARRRVGLAPIYDAGEGLWCDRALANGFRPYTRSPRCRGGSRGSGRRWSARCRTCCGRGGRRKPPQAWSGLHVVRDRECGVRSLPRHLGCASGPRVGCRGRDSDFLDQMRGSGGRGGRDGDFLDRMRASRRIGCRWLPRLPAGFSPPAWLRRKKPVEKVAVSRARRCPVYGRCCARGRAWRSPRP